MNGKEPNINVNINVNVYVTLPIENIKISTLLGPVEPQSDILERFVEFADKAGYKLTSFQRQIAEMHFVDSHISVHSKFRQRGYTTITSLLLLFYQYINPTSTNVCIVPSCRSARLLSDNLQLLRNTLCKNGYFLPELINIYFYTPNCLEHHDCIRGLKEIDLVIVDVDEDLSSLELPPHKISITRK